MNKAQNNPSRRALKAIGIACLALPLVVQAQPSSDSQGAITSDTEYQGAMDARIREIVRQELNERERQYAEEQARYAAEEQRRREAEQAAERAAQGLSRAIAGESDAVANAHQAQQAANFFINLVRRAVEKEWETPPDAGTSQSATAQVILGDRGELIQVDISDSSGNPEFDRSVIEAIESAGPFPEIQQLPPEQARDLRQFNLRFRPGDTR